MAPPQVNGYILNVPPGRRETLLDDERPAEPVEDFRYSRSHPLICFVSFEDGSITHLALGKPGRRAGTGLRRLNLDQLTQLANSIRYDTVLEAVPPRSRVHVQARFERGGLLPPGSFGAVVEAVRGLLPQSNALLRNESFGSFVFVQYKAMENEYGPAQFRLPNLQLAKELDRMEALVEQLRRCQPDDRLCGFRLTANPFFLKLCPRVVFDPESTSLIKGMYIPLEYWRRLEVDPSTQGPRKGRVITYANVRRYFTNTSFVDLVAQGWIGTAGMQTEVLDALISGVVEQGRAVTIAVRQQLPPQAQDGDDNGALPEGVEILGFDENT